MRRADWVVIVPNVDSQKLSSISLKKYVLQEEYLLDFDHLLLKMGHGGILESS